jgi:hypothetical protein
MNAKQPQPRPQGCKPAAPPPPPPPKHSLYSDCMKYKLPEASEFNDKTMYNACRHIQLVVFHKCKNNCGKCLYRNSFGVCIRDIACEIMKNIERKYDADSEEKTSE